MEFQSLANTGAIALSALALADVATILVVGKWMRYKGGSGAA
jgi:hypothetical protein